MHDRDEDAETRSASRCTGALPDCASATRRAICASAVSAPTLRRADDEPAVGVDGRAGDVVAGPTSTGTDSPVSSDWSTADSPSTTTPSVAIFSPGRTTNAVADASSSTGTSTSSPSRSTRASFAPSSSSARIASPERRFARASR